MRILLTGASGFIGSHLLPTLLEAGHEVRCLVRGSGTDDATAVVGDILKPETLPAAMEGCDAVIHLVGIIQEKPSRGITFERIHAEGTANVVTAARAAGIERFIHMSANGARADGVSRYQTSKFKAEESVASAGFGHWVIFRPSVVFGDPGNDHPEFCSQLANTLVGPFPVLPVFGDGKYRMQPVAVEDVAQAFAQALEVDAANGKRYCLGGPESFAYTEILDIIARGMGKSPKPKIHQPVWLVRPAIRTLGAWGLLPITPDQFEMLLDGNACDPAELERDFELPRVRFEAESLGYLR